MSKPLEHAIRSVKKHKGSVDDYIEIHEFLDMTKAAHPDMRHRAILHNSMGCYIAQKVFGVYIKNSEEKLIAVRDICEEHIIEDMGFIPTVSDYLDDMPMYNWLGGSKRITKVYTTPDSNQTISSERQINAD